MKKRLANTALVLLSLVIGLVIAEGVYRVGLYVHWRNYIKKIALPKGAYFYIFNKPATFRVDGLTKLRPNTDYTFLRYNGKPVLCAERKINARGELSALSPVANANFKILVVGDSFTSNSLSDSAHGEEWRDSYSADPKFAASVRELRATGKPIYLVHIPHPREIDARTEYSWSGPARRDAALLKGLETSLHTTAISVI